MKEHQKKQERRHDEVARERRRHLLILRAQHMVQRMSDAMSAPRPTLHVDDESRVRTEAQGAKGLMEDGAVYLHPAWFQPDTRDGRRLIAHETIHAAQHHLGQRGHGLSAGARVAESEAHIGADRFADGHLPAAPVVALGGQQVAADSGVTAELEGRAKARGFDSLSAFIGWIDDTKYVKDQIDGNYSVSKQGAAIKTAIKEAFARRPKMLGGGHDKLVTTLRGLMNKTLSRRQRRQVEKLLRKALGVAIGEEVTEAPKEGESSEVAQLDALLKEVKAIAHQPATPAAGRSSKAEAPATEAGATQADHAATDAAAWLKLLRDVANGVNELKPKQDKFATNGKVSEKGKDQVLTYEEGRAIMRVAFVETMGVFFGSYAGAKDHFLKVRLAKVPGAVVMHDTAATAIEGARARFQQEFGADFHKSVVGFGLRSLHKKHKYGAKPGHGLALAVDYKPYDNPMSGDEDIGRLIQLIGGGTPNLKLNDQRGKELGYGKRRKLIAGPDSEKRRHMMGQVQSAYGAMAQTSKNFQTFLGNDAQKLVDGMHQWHSMKAKVKASRKSRSKLRKKVSKVDKPLLQELDDIMGAFTATKTEEAGPKGKPEDRLKAWEAGVRTQLEDVDKQLAEATKSQKRSLKARKQKLNTLLQIGRDEKNVLDFTVYEKAEPSAMQALVKPMVDKVVGRIATLEQTVSTATGREKKSAQAELKSMQSLKGRLADPRFVYGANVKTVHKPSVAQLVERGHARNDAIAAPARATQPVPEGQEGPTELAPVDPKTLKPAFNGAFFKVMMEAGFEPGAAWSYGYIDTMHFEHAAMVDTITAAPTPDPTQLTATPPAEGSIPEENSGWKKKKGLLLRRFNKPAARGAVDSE